MKKPSQSLSSILSVLLALTGAACSDQTVRKEPEPPAIQKTEEAPVAKKVEEPAPKKPEPVEKTQAPAQRKAEQELNLGIRHYEEGNYKNAAGNFQNALEAGLLAPGDRITAHKFLAFIYCVAGEKMACRAEFKRVVSLNPRFVLTPAEAGHPIWGPIFREVKAEAASRKKKQN